MRNVLAFVLPLGLDSFAVAAALGTLRPGRRQRWRIAAVFVGFEAGMPLVGLALGTPIARAFAGPADYVAAAALIAVGVWLLWSGDEDAEQQRVRRLSEARGLAVLGLGLGISLDELAIGFTLGLVRLSVVQVIVAIAVQALVAAQLGLWLGARLSDRFREGVERVAAVLLIVLGVVLLLTRT